MITNPFEEINNRLSRIEQELIRQSSKPDSDQERSLNSSFLTVSEAAKFLGLAVQTIYGLVSRKKLPYYKRQKRVYFKKSDLIFWLESGRHLTREEIIAESHPILVKRGGIK